MRYTLKPGDTVSVVVDDGNGVVLVLNGTDLPPGAELVAPPSAKGHAGIVVGYLWQTICDSPRERHNRGEPAYKCPSCVFEIVEQTITEAVPSDARGRSGR